MREILYNIYLLFYHCNPDSAYGIDRAKEYNNNNSIYEEKIRYFANKYARPKHYTEYNRTQDWNFTLEFI